MNKAGWCAAGLITTLSLSTSLRATLAADARRGSEFFQAQGCVSCHAVDGTAPARLTKAPNLGQRYDRDYTPAGIASRMWDHAPVMWTSMSRQNVPLPAVSPEQAADLFAFFYSARYFEKPGEAERGKRVFQSKHCSECHSISATGPGTPVDQWASLKAPIMLVQRMWNHADLMTGEMASRHIPWPHLTPQELDDLLVYLQNLPQTRQKQLMFNLPAEQNGEELFAEKGCINCHKGELALENRLGDWTLTEVAAAMWNHAPQMQKPHPELSLPEMQQILGYVWAKQFFGTRGDAARGHKVFESKKCAACHDNSSSGAPALTKPAEPYSAITMVSVLWKHGPAMLRKMQDQHIAWPQLTQTDMANLIAYLNSR